MKIENLIWVHRIIDKLTFKQHVDISEVEEVFDNRPRIQFLQKGNRKGEDVYIALGRTEAGRYLAVIFIHKKGNHALIVSARDMRWTTTQVRQLHQLARQNTPTRVIGLKLGRTEHAVRTKASEKGVPLKARNQSSLYRRKK